ncbi:hypothetical protein ABZX51_004477 [Aspergillus tubingensis]
MSTDRKTVLITGCSDGGIGAALAETFHDHRYHVFATVRTLSKAPKTLTNSPNATILTLDVLDSNSITNAVEKVTKATGGKLDVLINNSGGSIILPAMDTSIEEGKKLFDLNFWAPFAVTQAFAPLLIRSKGCVVNNTSVNGALPFVFMSMYNSSKAAFMSASETWRMELAPLGVRTITLMTGGVKTKFFDNYIQRQVPETSYYIGAKDAIQKMGDGSLQDSGVDRYAYASKVVQAVERKDSGKLWVGGGAVPAKWALWLLPQWGVDLMMRKMFPVFKTIEGGLKKDA